MINKFNSNISFSGTLNVFSINPVSKKIENRLVDTCSIKSVKTSIQSNQPINTLMYRTEKGLQKCTSLNIFPDFTLDKLKKYIRAQSLLADKSGNVVDVLL